MDEDMDHDFETVDEKVAEVEFFLRQMADAGMGVQEFNYYFSAFLSSSRTTTLTLQRFKHIPGFLDWYDPHRLKLRNSKLAQFFLDTRNNHIHGGPYPVTGAEFYLREATYRFDTT